MFVFLEWLSEKKTLWTVVKKNCDHRRNGRLNLKAVRLDQSIGRLVAWLLCKTETNEFQRLLVFDRLTGPGFLIDTGVSISIIVRSQQLNNWKNLILTHFVVTGTVINSYGLQVLNMYPGFKDSFSWKFHIVGVSKPIIGAYFTRLWYI